MIFDVKIEHYIYLYLNTFLNLMQLHLFAIFILLLVILNLEQSRVDHL